MRILSQEQSAGPLTAELYAAVTNQARQFIFFQDYQVPDTPQGRFEMLALHLAFMLRRLKFLRPDERTSFDGLTQGLCDWVVADIEESLRAMRVSDLKITRHLKTFMEGFYGRLVAYDKALELNDKDMLEQAIRRNVYGIVDKIPDDIVEGLVAYTRQTWEWFQETSMPQIIVDLKGDS
jgi:cytochrome b pre-mRNA-processing protein 3